MHPSIMQRVHMHMFGKYVVDPQRNMVLFPSQVKQVCSVQIWFVCHVCCITSNAQVPVPFQDTPPYFITDCHALECMYLSSVVVFNACMLSNKSQEQECQATSADHNIQFLACIPRYMCILYE